MECSWANDNGGNCDWSWNSTEWQDTCSGGSFQLDTSYCEETPYELGDINQDGNLNVNDIVLIVNFVLGETPTEEEFLTADINQDGTLNILESFLQIKKRCHAVIITSDKSYKNLEIKRGYKENDL